MGGRGGSHPSKEGRKLFAALLPLIAAIPLSGIHLLWDVFGTIFLLLTIVQWREGSSLKPGPG